MQANINNLGIRKQGILCCFKEYHRTHNRIPDTPQELLSVTSSVLDEKNFQKYRKWFLEFAGDPNAK